MAGNIVVFGATGYAGSLTVESLLNRGVRPILAGRSVEQLAALSAANGGLEYRLADVNDPKSVRALVGPGDVLISTVGPFERYGFVAAEAAAAVGAHYVDSTGEVGFVQALRHRYHRTAVVSGATMLPAFGYDYVPGILAGTHAAQIAGPNAATLQVGYFATGSVRKGLSQGTRTTMADGLIKRTLARRDGELVAVRAASDVRRFPVRGRRVAAFLSSGTETIFLPEDYPNLGTIEVYNGWFRGLSRFVSVTSWVANACARSPRGCHLVERLSAASTGPPGGPDAVERARTRTHVAARALDNAGHVVAEAHVEGPSIYTLTGELIAVAAKSLQEGKAQVPGVISPIQAFGPEGFTHLVRAAGLTIV
jgi:short subunit dehydrogenase-like uncharacterized protein